LSDFIHFDSHWREALIASGLDRAQAFFAHPQIKIWRDVGDRQNGVFRLDLPGESAIRLHIKRDARPVAEPLALEARGIELLRQAGIPTCTPVAHGRITDGRTFIATIDLAGFRAVDAALRSREMTLDSIWLATARLTARLHSAELHHRDLYLNHFFCCPHAINGVQSSDQLYLIDAARVRHLPRWFTTRWIVKDVAQLFYSATEFALTVCQRQSWIEVYESLASVKLQSCENRILAKIESIRRHDGRLRRREPNRNLPLPEIM
jgi:hypothetical protein